MHLFPFPNFTIFSYLIEVLATSILQKKKCEDKSKVMSIFLILIGSNQIQFITNIDTYSFKNEYFRPERTKKTKNMPKLIKFVSASVLKHHRISNYINFTQTSFG